MTVRLFDRLAQVFAERFLLDHHFRLGDIPVDKTGGAVQLHLIFERDELLRLGHTKDITKHREPKLLAFSLFVTFAFPILRKSFRCCFLFRLSQCH